MSSAPKPNQQKLPLIRKSVSDFLQRTTNLHAVVDDQQKSTKYVVMPRQSRIFLEKYL